MQAGSLWDSAASRQMMHGFMNSFELSDFIFIVN